MESNDQLYLYSTEKISKAIMILAVPSVLSALINLIYNLINSIYLGMLDNTAMIAAITVAAPLIYVIYAFGSALGVGASSYISRQLGAQEFADSQETVKTVITAGIIVSGLLMLFGWLGMRPILALLTDDAQVLGYAYIYTLIIYMGSLTISLKQIIINLLKTEADIVYPMYVMLAGVGINIALAPVLMFDWGFNLGIIGAAIATICADIVSTLILLWRLCTHTRYVRWHFGHFGICFTSLKEIVSVGSAVFVRNFLPSLSTAIFASTAGLFGTAFVAGAGVGKRASQIALFAIQGMGNGFLPFAAYNYGARNRKRLRDSILLLIRALTIYAVFMSVLFFFFAAPICRLYSSDPEVVYYGSFMLRFYVISLINQGAYNVLLVTLQGFGRNRASMMVSLARGAFFYIPIVYYLPRLFGEIGIYLAQPLTDWLTIFTLLFISRHMIRELLLTRTAS